MHRWLVIVSACAIAARTAHADGLTWHAPPECPDNAAVRKAIEQRLEAPLDSVAFSVDVDITHDDSGYTAQVKTGTTDPRILTSASCEEVTDAVAVVVARLATEARAAAVSAAPPKPAPVIAVVAPPPVITPAEPSPWNGGVRVTAIIGSGNGPEPDVGGELAAWAGWRDAFVELGAARWLTKRAAINDATLAGVDVQLNALALRAGWRFSLVRVWLGGELGRLHGSGFGLTGARDGDATWLSAGGGFGLVLEPRKHMRVLLGFDLEIAIDRAKFALDSGEPIYQSGAFALRLGMGIEWVWR